MSTEASPTTPEMALTGPALIQALRHQIEYYFSEQNLQADQFLVSQMDAQMFVPLKTIASFKRVRQLTSDMSQLISAVKESKTVSLDPTEAMIRPVASNKRHILIVRDIPSNADQASVRALFQSPCPSPVELRAEIGNNWFLYFADEQATVAALEHARTQSWQGVPLKARVKSESLLKGGFTPMTQMAYQPAFDGNHGIYMGGGGERRGNQGRRGNRTRGDKAGNANNAMGMQDGGRSRVNSNGKNAYGGGQIAGQQGAAGGGGGKKKSRKGGKDSSAPALSPQHFPPLPTKTDGGYLKGEIQVYSVDFMRELFKTLPTVRPGGVDTGCPVVLSVPDTTTEFERPDSDRRYSIDLDKKMASRQSGPSARSGLGKSIAEEDDVLLDAAMAVAEVEAEEALRQTQETVEGGDPKTYASLLRGR